MIITQIKEQTIPDERRQSYTVCHPESPAALMSLRFVRMSG